MPDVGGDAAIIATQSQTDQAAPEKGRLFL